MARKKNQDADERIIYGEEIPLYTITIYNDNETTAKFVIKVLEQVFEQTHHDSFLIMMRANI